MSSSGQTPAVVVTNQWITQRRGPALPTAARPEEAGEGQSHQLKEMQESNMYEEGREKGRGVPLVKYLPPRAGDVIFPAL